MSYLDGLSPDAAARFFLLRRSSIPPESIAALVRPLLPPMLSEDAIHGLTVAISGASKALAVQLAECAKEVAGDAPISDVHMVSSLSNRLLRFVNFPCLHIQVEAYRRLAAQGIILGIPPEVTSRTGDIDVDMVSVASTRKPPQTAAGITSDAPQANPSA